MADEILCDEEEEVPIAGNGKEFLTGCAGDGRRLSHGADGYLQMSVLDASGPSAWCVRTRGSPGSPWWSRAPTPWSGPADAHWS